MSTPWSKRRPAPWDIELDIGDDTGWHGLMLVPGQDGLLVARRSNPLAQVSPTTFEYGSYPPDVESTFVFGRLVGGMGEHVQSSATSKRYRYADRVDCSIGGMPRLGPAFTDETFPGLPAPTYPEQNEVRQFIVFRDDATGLSAPVLFALVRDHVYLRRDGAWILSKDFGVAAAPQRAVVYRGLNGGEGLWVATAIGELWKYDDTTWTQADLAGVADGGAFAERIAVVGREMYIGSGSHIWIAKPTEGTNDPLLAESWSGRTQVGNQATSISELAALDDVLFILKWDGIHTLNADASDNDLFPELRAAQQIGAGRHAAAWDGALWFGFRDAYYRLEAGGTLQPVGPERLIENVSLVRGRPVSGAGHGPWFLYLAVHNADTGASHLLKYGTWTAGQETAAYRFADAWHGALASWPKRVSRVDVIQFRGDADGAAPGPALWVGFADGTAAWTPLPSRTPDPALDSACRFAATGTVYAPIHDAVFGADRKSFHAATALAPLLNASLTAQVVYRVDPPNFYPDDVPPYQRLSPQFSASGQRWSLPDLTDGVPRDASTGWRLDFGVELRTDADTASPVLEGIALHEAIRPHLHLVWSFTVAASNRLCRRDGVVASASAEAIRALLREAAAAPGHVRLRTPDELVGGFAALSYREQLAPDRGRDGLDWRIAVECAQFR